ncbi:hypothetical protein PFDG_00596 [Plasmodium falciparum Dd2]|uniref:Stevor n=8 Tax=Plasmodium falciparum TaxID=5833 RepID=A0A0L7LXM9_PLAF4|nr:hypothetical protein PFDG_00596 [Plasmodium falciparum Dd2]
MNIYYNNMLVMSFLLNVLLLSDNVNNQNKKYNVGYVKNSTRMIIMKSRRLSEIQLPRCPHYHNDPELKKIIDKLNEERIKKYIETNNSFEEIHELLGEDIKLNDKSCEYQNIKISGDELASSHKIHDNYLDNLRKGCFGGVGICTLCSILVSNIGIGYAVTAAKGIITNSYSLVIADKFAKVLAGVYFFFSSSIENAAVPIFSLFHWDAMRIASTATTAFLPYGIAALFIL